MTTMIFDPRTGDLVLLSTRQALGLSVPVVILAYIAYTAVAFDLAVLAERTRRDNARVLLADFVSYKTQRHPRQSQRRGCGGG